MRDVPFKGSVSILLSCAPARWFILTDPGFLLAASSALYPCRGCSDSVSGALSVCPAQLLSLLPSRDASGCAGLGEDLASPIDSERHQHHC